MEPLLCGSHQLLTVIPVMQDPNDGIPQVRVVVYARFDFLQGNGGTLHFENYFLLFPTNVRDAPYFGEMALEKALIAEVRFY